MFSFPCFPHGNAVWLVQTFPPPPVFHLWEGAEVSCLVWLSPWGCHQWVWTVTKPINLHPAVPSPGRWCSALRGDDRITPCGSSSKPQAGFMCTLRGAELQPSPHDNWGQVEGKHREPWWNHPALKPLSWWGEEAPWREEEQDRSGAALEGGSGLGLSSLPATTVLSFPQSLLSLVCFQPSGGRNPLFMFFSVVYRVAGGPSPPGQCFSHPPSRERRGGTGRARGEEGGFGGVFFLLYKAHSL